MSSAQAAMSNPRGSGSMGVLLGSLWWMMEVCARSRREQHINTSFVILILFPTGDDDFFQVLLLFECTRHADAGFDRGVNSRWLLSLFVCFFCQRTYMHHHHLGRKSDRKQEALELI